jgi:hypothetical protein
MEGELMDRRDRDMKWYDHFDEKRMVIVVTQNEDGDTGEPLEVPAVFEVCGTCDGQGKHVAPGIDSHGLSAEDFDEDPDFAEDYFAGRYDIPCNECHGKRVVPVIAENCDPVLKAKAEKWEQDWYDYQREIEAERRMGA